MTKERMKIEKAAKIITELLPLDQDEAREAWSVVADMITERGQYPPLVPNRRDGSLDFETYKAKVQIGKTGPVTDLWVRQQEERKAERALLLASQLALSTENNNAQTEMETGTMSQLYKEKST